MLRKCRIIKENNAAFNNEHAIIVREFRLTAWNVGPKVQKPTRDFCIETLVHDFVSHKYRAII